MKHHLWGNTITFYSPIVTEFQTADGEVVAVGEICDRDFSIAGAFPEHSLVDVTSRDILPAHLYPVSGVWLSSLIFTLSLIS